jgi:hypothetical protein
MHKVITIQDLRLPKFDKNRRINQQKILVLDNNDINYNIILSTSLFSRTGFKSNYSKRSMEWFDYSIPICLPRWLDSNEYGTMQDMFHIQVKDELFGEDWLRCFATEILDDKHEKKDVVDVMKELTHLNAHQKADLLWVLQENKKMFDETLNVYPHKKVHIDIDPNAKFVHFVPHPVPQIPLKTFKMEDNRVRWISNSPQLNKIIRCKQYQLLIITDILRKCSGYKVFTKLNVSMQYYMFELDKKVKTPVPSSHHLVNIITWDSQWDSNALQTLLKQLWK